LAIFIALAVGTGVVVFPTATIAIGRPSNGRWHRCLGFLRHVDSCDVCRDLSGQSFYNHCVHRIVVVSNDEKMWCCIDRTDQGTTGQLQ
jgi:hypothetical protein